VVLDARPWLLPVATLAGVLLAAALATLYGGLQGAPSAVSRAAIGTVVESTPCANAGARDTVVFVIDGWSHRLPLDACGHPHGVQLDVELVTTEGGRSYVRLAGAGDAPRNVLAERIGAVLFALAGLSGALLGVVAAPRRS
jgi:hypothetical protein